MSTKKSFLKFIFAIVFLIIIFFLSSQAIRLYRPANIKMVTIAGQRIVVDVALDDEGRQRGLGGRASIADDEGMLFVFDQPDKYSFWMKDMNFPIDIIWIGENMQVVAVKKNALPELYPETYEPDQDAKYVLEVVASFAEKNNLKEGDKVEFGF